MFSRTHFAFVAVSIAALSTCSFTFADTLFATSAANNEVYRFDVPAVGSPLLNLTLTTNLDRPAGVVVSPQGELFVVNRGNSGGGSGSIARFTNATGATLANGIIADNNSVAGFNFNLPHDLAFRNNELFVVNSFNNNVLRFNFNGAGTASSNGIISNNLGNGNPRGVGFNSSGELFVSEANLSSQQMNRYQFDGSGNVTTSSEFSTGGAGIHGIAFAPWGEMFVAAANSDAIARVTFDGLGNPVSNGFITGNGLNIPLGVSFSSSGELFVGNNFNASYISRFTFDSAHNFIPNGTFSTPTGVGFLQFAPEAVPEPLTAAGVLLLTGRVLGRRSRETV